MAHLLARPSGPCDFHLWVDTEEVKKIGGWKAYLQRERSWKPGKKIAFIFDGAQHSYDDFGLWHDFFASMRFAIAFASYGGPTSFVTMRNKPFSNKQSITLGHKDHGDVFGPVRILLTRAELDDLIGRRFPLPEFRFDHSIMMPSSTLPKGICEQSATL